MSLRAVRNGERDKLIKSYDDDILEKRLEGDLKSFNKKSKPRTVAKALPGQRLPVPDQFKSY